MAQVLSVPGQDIGSSKGPVTDETKARDKSETYI
jgi:hypothetical protein